jgi:hypothetical protein
MDAYRYMKGDISSYASAGIAIANDVGDILRSRVNKKLLLLRK